MDIHQHDGMAFFDLYPHDQKFVKLNNQTTEKGNNMDKQSREVYAEYLRIAADNLDNIKQINNEYELKDVNGGWHACNSKSVLTPVFGIRKRKLTVTINGHEVVPPITDRLPDEGEDYWVLGISSSGFITWHQFYDDIIHRGRVRLGWHKNKKECNAYWSAVLESHLVNYK